MSAQRQSNLTEALDEALAELQAQRWSATSLQNWLAAIVHYRFELQAAKRVDWQVGLRVAWEQSGWSFSELKLAQYLILGADWHDWPLVIAIASHLQNRRPLSAAEKSLLAQAYLHCGDTKQAIDHYRSAVLAEPFFQPALFGLQYAQTWADYCARFPCYQSGSQTRGELRLELLGEHHLQDFAWQFYDSTIAQLCCLPHFESDEHWRRWLTENHAKNDQLTFAVIHANWGFIGSVSLILQDGIGLFYYWIGRDYQGNGFGPSAVSLLFHLAESYWGMRACYAKVFADNLVSRRGLSKLGFEPVDFVVDSDRDNEIYLRRPGAGETSLGIDAMAEEARHAFTLMNLQSSVRRPCLPGPISNHRLESPQHRKATV